jgi:hypothetical protein
MWAAFFRKGKKDEKTNLGLVIIIKCNSPAIQFEIAHLKI